MRQFAKALHKKADQVETAGSRLAVIGTLAAVETLVAITPVDTSEHLSNWQIALGSPALSGLPPYSLGSRGSTQAASSRATVAAARTALAYKKPGQTVFISNLGPAIVKLDHGWSSQFAGGFVPRAVLSFRKAVEGNVTKIFK